ncbi:MAG: hypothetical protein COS94_04325 [Candidatus Hydrogenedentes bacterium CG07_land_8_20_14_0_80_42_17]|nr:MAG: hypothetical protein AUJ18_03860 [Candidatus Hydrogenedentes bacterium CG1_02_42_14]PIU48032.1 MAG: hypothetical protein COS94_04325 [Candidatus Hydrogenedentes bacterium CG07_land_8_20_14_0_80_42_17]
MGFVIYFFMIKKSILIFCAVSLSLLLLASGRLYSLDDETNYLVTRSICEYGRIDISPQMEKPINVSAGRSGKLYSYYAPGTSFFGIPFYFAGKLASAFSGIGDIYITRAFFSLQGSVWGGLCAAILFIIITKLGYDEKTAVAISLINSFATYSFALSHTIISNFPVGVLYLLAWSTIFENEKIFRKGLASGIALSLAFLYRYDSALFWPILLIGRPRRASGIILGLIPGIVLGGVYNFARFGSVLDTGAPDMQNMFAGNFGEGFLGLTIHPSRGILWYSPLTVLGLFGLILLKKKFGKFMLIPFIIGILHILIVSSHSIWNGGACWGPRHLGSIVPMLSIGLIPFIKVRKKWIKNLGVVSAILIQLYGTVVATDSWNDLLWDYGINYEVSWSTVKYNPWYGQFELLKRVNFQRLPAEYQRSKKIIPVGDTAPNQIMRKSIDQWSVYAWKMGINSKIIILFLVMQIAITLFFWKRVNTRTYAS